MTVVRGDVTDQPLIERVLAEYEIRTVFHLAAQTIVTVANRSPIGTFDTNIRGTWSVLEACRRSTTVTEIVVATSDPVRELLRRWRPELEPPGPGHHA